MLYQTTNPHGGDLYSRPIKLDFSANTNPLGTPEAVKQAVRNCLDCLHQYPDPYCRELTAAISAFEQVPVEKILCGSGAAELIFSYCSALRPKKALELAPTFSEYSAALESVGCQVERYSLKQNKDFALDEEFLSFLEKGDWDVLVLCNPNNPTGQLLPEKRLDRIVEICYQKNMRLFVDECFLDLCDEEKVVSLKRKLDAFPNLFILKAFTKSYGMAALRLGYGLCADTRLLTAMSRSVQSWNVSLPAQKAGIAALQEQNFLRKAKKIIRTEREWMKGQLEHIGFYVCPSAVNFLLFYSPYPLKEKLLEQGIQLRDCANYHSLGEGWYRMAVKLPEQNRQLMEAIDRIVQERAEE